MSTTIRDLRKEEFWRRQVRQWRQGGLSVREFCRQRALSEPSFYAWRRTLRQREAQTAQAAKRLEANADAAFVPVRVVAPPQDAAMSRSIGADSAVSGLELVLPAGRRLRIGPAFDAATLRRLLAVLEDASVEGKPCS